MRPLIKHCEIRPIDHAHNARISMMLCTAKTTVWDCLLGN